MPNTSTMGWKRDTSPAQVAVHTAGLRMTRSATQANPDTAVADIRVSEVAQLRLEDIDWRNATVRVHARKTGHGALLPLPAEVGAALADYLQHARPDTHARQVFVTHRLRVGEPISGSIVRQAVDKALRHAGVAAPMRGANLLRHSLATELLAHGVSLREIADLFGHRSLATTRIYAAVDVAALRQVALPWPVTS